MYATSPKVEKGPFQTPSEDGLELHSYLDCKTVHIFVIVLRTLKNEERLEQAYKTRSETVLGRDVRPSRTFYIFKSITSNCCSKV